MHQRASCPLEMRCRLQRAAGWAGFLLLTLATCLHANTDHRLVSIRNWHSGHGLPDDGVYCISQCKDGYIWIATERGVCRFDGTRFIPVQIPELSVGGHQRCSFLYSASDGSMWAAFNPGVLVHWVNNQPVVLETSKKISREPVVNICEDKQGGLFVSFRNGSAVRIVAEKVTTFTKPQNAANEEPLYATTGDDGTVWAACQSSLAKFESGRFRRVVEISSTPKILGTARNQGCWLGLEDRRIIQIGNNSEIRRTISLPEDSGTISCLCEGPDGTLWIGTRNGPGCGLFQLGSGDQEASKIYSGQISHLFADRENNLWVATLGEGILQVLPSFTRFLPVEANPAVGVVTSFAIDSEDQVWVATKNGACFRAVHGKWETLQEKWGKDYKINWVDTAADGCIILSSVSNGLFRARGDEITPLLGNNSLPLDIKATFRSRSGDLWLSSTGRIIRIRDGTNKEWILPAGTSARLFTEDIYGGIIFAPRGGRLFRIFNEQMQEIAFAGTGQFPIHGLYSDRNGNTWIGFVGGGLGRLRDNQFVRVTLNEGLPDDTVSQVIQDDRGYIWINTSSSLSRFDPADFEALAAGRRRWLNIMALPHREGEDLPHGAFREAGYCCRAYGNELWFTAGNRILILNPEARPINTVAPPLKLEAVRVDGVEFPVEQIGTHPLELPPDHNSVSFHFTALSFSSPENVQFRYKIDGFNREWIESGPERRGAYSRLPAGFHQFRVIACNNDGVWNENPATVAFIVAPFFWQTWWFRTGILVLVVTAVTAIVRLISFRRLRWQLRLLAHEAAFHKERARVARDLHDNLGNRLTHITLLADLPSAGEQSVTEVGKRLQQISARAKEVITALDETVWAVNPRNDSLPRFVEYIGQFAVNFLSAAQIECRLTLPEDAAGLQISAEMRHHAFLAVSEILNNAVRHSKASIVTLDISFAGAWCNIAIEDNGIGFEQRSSNLEEDGLTNLEDRMREAGGIIHIESESGIGTRIALKIPFAGRKANPRRAKSPY